MKEIIWAFGIWFLLALTASLVGCENPTTFHDYYWFDSKVPFAQCKIEVHENCGLYLAKCSDSKIYKCLTNVRVK